MDMEGVCRLESVILLKSLAPDVQIWLPEVMQPSQNLGIIQRENTVSRAQSPVRVGVVEC